MYWDGAMGMKPRKIPGYTLAHFLLDRAFVSITEPGRIQEHEELMLPRVAPYPPKRKPRKGRRGQS